MSKRTIRFLVIFFVLLMTILYFYFGGLNKIEVTLEKVSDYNMVGKHFQGKGDDNFIEEAFFEAKSYLESNQLEGRLTIVHYNDTTLEKEEIKLFIGVLLAQGTSEIPEDYERLSIPATNAIRATISAHNVVMPSPGTVENRIKSKAEELNLRLTDFTIEQYVSARELLIDMPVK